jgi:insecticidal toxin complex protein TccC
VIMTRTTVAAHANTPSVTVRDNRGLTVRDIAYHRHPDTPDVTRERITRHRYDARGALSGSADPRLHDTGLANFTYLTDLAGTVLRTVSADAGITVQLNDIAGRPFLGIDANGITRTWQYEEASLPGRPLSMTEQVASEAVRLTERFAYAGNTPAEQALNLAGTCVSHYDTAGLVQTDSVALSGVPLSVTRRLLKDADNPARVADWQGGDTSAWNDLLAGESHTTLTTVDATGAVLTTTDAKGNLQRVAYDVAGLLSGSWLTLKGGTEQVIVKSLTYSAAGQKLREVHGNGVVTTYTYEPETQRLVGIKTERPAGHAAGAKVLQDLRYEYDPVGNVLKVSNDAEETRFWRNQKVVPENTYVYDSLYQLVGATGREMANAGSQSTRLPAATVPFPTDDAAFTNYTRTYSYDTAGNLTQVRHRAPATSNSYTTAITVSDRSNRAVLSTLTENPADVDALFTAGGQQKQLQPGQHLGWTARNELLKVTPVTREGGTDDSESYRYEADSQRLLKVSRQKMNNGIQTRRVLYLPGLERRTTANGSAETEDLSVITVGEAGRAQVRVLHWTSGKPGGIDNDQVRWSYANLIGSSGLELDKDGNVISLEEYYPYGGTAVWTARSVLEADYKTVRYSGKERDATGLYYYGHRYYQPWAGRWLSTDPAGTVDGLNLFRMVRNNPVMLSDPDGRSPVLAESDKKNPHTDLDIAREMIGKSTGRILEKAQEGTNIISKLKGKKLNEAMADMKFTNNKLKDYAAHAAVVIEVPEHNLVVYKKHFFNLRGKLTKNERFAEVEVRENDNPLESKYKVNDKALFLNKIKEGYETKKIHRPKGGSPNFISDPTGFLQEKPVELHSETEKRITKHLEDSHDEIPMMAGIAGLHAEVQALNFAMTELDRLGVEREEGLKRTYIYTKRLVGKEKNVDFPACYNCSGILSGPEHVMTGRV